jgi:hypothetical protein
MQQLAGQETQEGHNERQKRRWMGGGGMMRGDKTNSQGGREATAPEKKRGTTRCGGVTRGGQVEVLLDWRRWRDKKLRWQRTKGITTASQDR